MSTCGRHDGAGCRRAARGARGFNLIEVMMAVLILALGLLGLGAIFPVAINAQREGADATFGTVAGRAAQAYLTTPIVTGYAGASKTYLDRTFWSAWERSIGQSDPNDLNWQPATYDDASDPNGGPSRLLLGPAATQWAVPMAERLYPPDSVPGANPQLAWDAVVRRVDPDSEAMQVAVFVRRLDPRIRVGDGRTLARVLTRWEGLPAREKKRAVGERNARPTLDGTGTYSAPRTMRVRFDGSDPKLRDRLYRRQAQDDAWAYAAQVGQVLVDNLGNVYTVTGAVTDGSEAYVTVKPPAPALATNDRLTQVVFTAQPPRWVHVFTVNER